MASVPDRRRRPPAFGCRTGGTGPPTRGRRQHRQRPAIACPQVLQPLAPPLAQRLVAEHSLGKEQPLDPVDVPHPLAHQRPALAADTPAVLLLQRRRPGHRAHPWLAALEGHQGTHQGLAIDPVGLCPPPPARGQDRGGVDHVALDPFGLQHPVDPEAVQTSLLDDDNREVSAGPRRSLAPELGEPTQKPRHVARQNRVLGHLLPAPGDRDVISQADRLSSKETKIAPRSVRIAGGASARSARTSIGRLQSGWV
jgi:hypothetical protein